MNFWSSRPVGQGRKEWTTEAVFYDAQIQVDAILSYPWMEKGRYEGFPLLESLVKLSSSLDRGPLKVITGWGKPRPDSPRPPPTRNREDGESVSSRE